MVTAEEAWFLTAEERGNDSTGIDRRRGDGTAWTTGNVVTPLIHGSTYFNRLYQEIVSLGPGGLVWFADWRGDADERLVGPGSELGGVLVEAVGRGVDVRGLVWRSHPDEE